MDTAQLKSPPARGRGLKPAVPAAVVTPSRSPPAEGLFVDELYHQRETSSQPFKPSDCDVNCSGCLVQGRAWYHVNHSTMAAQAQVQRVRVEIVLVPQVGLVEFTDIVIEQGDRDDQRYIGEAIGFDHLQHLLFFIR